jgi:hypothetical protein
VSARARLTAALLACAPALAAQVPARPPARPAERPPAPPADTAALRRAQDPEVSGGGAALARYNAPGTRRARGPVYVPAGRTVAGDLAVVGGPVTVAGRVTGRLTVIDGDLLLRPGAAVDGDVLVVGGLVDGQRVARLGGELRVVRQRVAYEVGPDSLLVDADGAREPRDRAVLLRSRTPEGRTTTGITVASGGTYNRVEGLPVLVGPTLETAVGRTGRLTVDLLGIGRVVGPLRWDAEHLGYVARAELRGGRRRAPRIGARLYDEVAPVEAWQLAADEVALGAFLLRRDFRDYYNRRGRAAMVGYDLSPDVGASLTVADERWSSRRALDAFTLLRGGRPWRANPRADEGRVTVATASVRLDTRNDVARPWAGWYVGLDYEVGGGRFTQLAPLSAATVAPGAARGDAPGWRAYGRGFLDLRRYNRLTPDAQLNLRLVAGGWLHGDPLPAQRRLSVSGPGALAGFDFRAPAGPGGADVAQCGAGALAPAGAPAECERVLVLQTEYRSDVRLSLFGEPREGEPRVRRGLRTEFTWVLFADAGRGWLVGPRTGALAYPAGAVPGLDTFLTQVGAGVDFGHPHGRRDLGPFGVYVVKSVSRPDQAANLVLRLHRRF